MATAHKTPGAIASATMPAVALVVLNWNGANDTLACLVSLETLTYPNFRVLLVDNGSTDDSIAQFRAYSAPYPLELLTTNHNLGYAGGNNVGTRRAIDTGAEFVLILNNDTTVSPELLEQLVESAQRHPDAGVFSARLLYFDRPSTVWFDGAEWNRRINFLEWPGQDLDIADLPCEDHETAYACGAALFFRVRVVQQIGLLDELFFLVWEEVDWCYRAREAGWKILVVPSARVWHKVGASFGSECSPLRTYFSTRNELLWFQRHASRAARIRIALKTLERLAPKFCLSRDPVVSVFKRFLWATADYLDAWLGKGTRFEYLSKRRAILDYICRRFGDCPKEVRVWSATWATSRKAV
jgi:GT2 family glycosyltransferase